MSPVPRPFIVNLADANTGREFQERIWAEDQREAAALCKRDGVLIAKVFEEPLPVVVLADESRSSTATVEHTLAYLLRELQRLNDAPMIRHPKSTIAWALVLWAPLLAIALCGAAIAAIVLFGHLISAAAR